AAPPAPSPPPPGDRYDSGYSPPPEREPDFIPPGYGAQPPQRRNKPDAPRSSTLSLAERLTCVLLNTPSLVSEHPLPADIEELELPHLDLLLQVADLLRDQPDLPAPALLGTVMALEQGESLTRLLRETLRPAMDEATARRYWRDALKKLEVTQLENAIAREQAAPAPDIRRLAALSKALSDARLTLAAPLN